MNLTTEQLDKLKGEIEDAKLNEALGARVVPVIQTLIKFVKDAKAALEQRVDSALDSLTEKIDAKLSSIRQPQDGYTPVKGRDYRDGIDGYTPIKGKDYFDGEPGRDADPVDAEAAIQRIEDDLPQLGERIRDGLELLRDEDRLDASAIKNLPEATREVVGGMGHPPLWSLSDVHVPGIQAGQSLTWNGINWEAYTPAGGSGATPVYGEVLQTQDATGDTFALADTPTAGTVRLFRGGAYQSVANGDYSITGAEITLTIALQDGETLVADYTPA